MHLQLDDPRLLLDRILVNGDWLSTGETFAVDNPATGQFIANVASAGARETEAAVAAAATALPKWREKTAKERANLLRRWSPFIMFDDADLDAAIDGLMVSKYRNSGQTCVCTNRVLVQDGVYAAFVEKLAEKS